MKQKQEIKLSDHFTYGKLIRFTLPSIAMMIFTSIYGVVDGIFVSNFAGATPFAAINLVMPFLMIFSAIGMMVGAGGTALVSMKLGAGRPDEAKGIFSLLTYLIIGVSLVLTLIGEFTIKQVAVLLGATDDMLPYCVLYGRIFLIGLVAFMLQAMFQSFLITAEKPKLGLVVTIAAGVTNMVLDALLVGLFDFGVAGAAIATILSQSVGGIIPLIYFIAPNKSLLRLGSPSGGIRAIWMACSNGISEFLSNVSGSIVNMVYNWQLLRLIGEEGVTAFGIIMYVCFIFIALFFGYGMGSAPVVGFHYGAGNRDELKSLFKKSLTLIGAASIVLVAAAELLAKPLAMIFVGYDADLLALSTRALRLYSLSYLLTGFNIFASGFFTALNNGQVSAVISFSRVFLFQVVAVIVLPLIFGANGIWLAVLVAEIFSLFVSLFFILKEKNRYGY